jgi:magnesium transporter
MLSVFPPSDSDDRPPAWIDLMNADDSEIKQAETRAKLRVPTREALSEIESSSRLFFEKDALYLSMPLITRTVDDQTALMPIGFVVSSETLLTIRFGDAPAVDAVAEAVKGIKAPKADDIFARILEAIVDRAADRLEHLGAQLDAVSYSAFHVDRTRKRNLAKASDTLRGVLRNIGQTGDRLSQIRDTLLGLHRICAFVIETPRCGFSEGVIQRLKAVHADISSLNSYEEHLANKVQFLLDATLGFISIEQNDIVKILTVVSVVGVPPVLVAGVYGMNFKVMPELSWAWGYPFSLALMVVSAIVPIAWFKWRGWM